MKDQNITTIPEDLLKYVPQVRWELIPIKNLVSNQDYQRLLSQRHVIKTAENFDIYQVNPVKVSRRNGTNYVFNGQHTIETIALASGSRETPVWCMIYDDLIYEHEADIFANQDKYVKSLLPYDKFNANIEAGNDKQLTIKAIVESYDLTISRSATPGGVCAISTLEYIFDKYGYHCLDRTLRLCVGTWEGEAHSLSANMLKGISRLVNAYGDKMKDDRFKEKLGNVSVKEISRAATERRNGSLGYAEALVSFYNKAAKTSHNTLRREELYSHKIPNKAVPYIDNTDNEESEENNYQFALF